MSKLQWKLLTKKRGSSTSQRIPPGREDLLWVTGTVTLIYGERDAVLVDTFLSEQHAKELLDWVIESGKNLTTIYVTHAHGDHFFGLKHLLDKFLMQRQSALSAKSPFWLGVDTGYASLAASSSQANSSSRSGM